MSGLLAAIFILTFIPVIDSRAQEFVKMGDWVEIISVTPNHYDNYTDAVTFTATINYSLQSKKQGIVYLGFNTDKPECYTYAIEPEDRRIVSKGRGTVVLSATVTPVNWGSGLSLMYQFMNGNDGSNKDFLIYAMLCEYPHDEPPKPLADFKSVLTDLPEVGILYGDSANPEKKEFDSLEKILDNIPVEEYEPGKRVHQYNPVLSHMLITLCNSVHDNTNMETTFQSMGFDDNITDYDMEGILLAYGMGKKQLQDGSTLVLVVARGTGDFSWNQITNIPTYLEWYSNIIDAGTNEKGKHSGFSDAADELYDRMIDFLGTEDFSNTKFVITGHSRGAAAADIMAARLVDKGVSEEEIYAYTFACPDVAVITQEKADSYSCIYNIGNVNDIVTWVPGVVWTESGEDYGWGKDSYWNKYGQNYWYCDDWNDYNSIQGRASLNIGERIGKYHLQNLYMDYLSDEKELNCYKKREETVSVIQEAVEKQKKDRAEKNKETRDNINKVIQTGETEILEISVYCPVDVLIMDQEGNQVVSITGEQGTISEDAGNKAMISFCNDKKKIFIKNTQGVNIQLMGTGDGVMRLSIVRDILNPEKGGKTFENVKLYDGKIMHCVCDNNVEASDIQLFQIDEEKNEVAEIMSDGVEVDQQEEAVEDHEEPAAVVADPVNEKEDTAGIQEAGAESGKTDMSEEKTEETESEKTDMFEEEPVEETESGGKRILYAAIIGEAFVIFLLAAVLVKSCRGHRRKGRMI